MEVSYSNEGEHPIKNAEEFAIYLQWLCDRVRGDEPENMHYFT